MFSNANVFRGILNLRLCWGACEYP